MRGRLSILFVLISFFTYSQLSETYKDYIKSAEQCYQKGDFLNASIFYSKAFEAMHDRGLAPDRYNAAISFAHLNKADSAFKHLIRLAEKTDYLDCERIETQKEFEKLKSDGRWLIVHNAACGTNYELHLLLNTIRKEDQGPRSMIDSIMKTYGATSRQFDSLTKVMRANDEADLFKIDSIYSIYGWPSPKLVGKKANQAFWLVIQHSPLAVQEKYLPIMQQAVKDGRATPADCAYLEDRVLMLKNLPQKYGTQYQYKIEKNNRGRTHLYKLEDASKVNEYRHQVGLLPLPEEDITSSLEKE